LYARYGTETVTYKYGKGTSEAEVTTWVTDPADINEKGMWIAKATVAATDSWKGASALALFEMWDDPTAYFEYWTEFTIKARSGATETLSNFKVPIRISPERMPGFSYEREGQEGKGLLFADADGNLLTYEIDTWNPNGESAVWLKLATLPPQGMKVKMYWDLRSGRESPLEYSPDDVWSEYIGVWHMSETEDGATTVKDSTGNKDGTSHGKSVVSEGIVGSARGRTETGANGAAVTIAANTVMNGITSGQFTISGWVKLNSTATGQAYLFARKNSDNYAGWGSRFPGNNADSVRFYTSGNNNYYTVSTTGKFAANTWTKYDYVCTGSNKQLSLYINGALVATSTINALAAGTSQPFTVGGMNVESTSTSGYTSTLDGYTDELRMRKSIVSAEWIAAEYAAAADPSFITSAAVHHNDLLANAWLTLPEMNYATWDKTDTPGTLVSSGTTLYGNVTSVIYSVYAPEQVYDNVSDITEPGVYHADFYSTEVEGAETISYTIEIRVTQKEPYSRIAGENGNSGRVLLMNRDTNTKCPIDRQGYSDTGSTRSTFWQHFDAEETDLSYNLKAGTSSVLWTLGYGQRLWHLDNCRHGNTYPTAKDAPLALGQAYLPFASTSKSIMDRSKAVDQTTAGQIVMRNLDDATVYSPCYEEGVGTVYFDAVNGWAEATENYKIVVEYATSTVENVEPTDANSVLVTTNIVDEVEEITTNWYGKLDGCWQKAKMLPFLRDGTAEFAKLSYTNELSLAVVNGGSKENFYRVVVPLGVRSPVRFRIRRTSHDNAWGADDQSMILLDNVIASYPPMGGDLYSAGRYDESKIGSAVLGWELSTSVPYPSKSDESIFGRGVPVYYTNTGDGSPVDTSTFFSLAKMHYRWNYLGQVENAWQEVSLNPSDGFRAMTPLATPGRECDMEYWFEYALQAPYYAYVDYSGLGKTIDYTEEPGVQTNALYAASNLPSGSTNWFFRVRAGKSEYSSFDIVYRRGDPEVEGRVRMMLVNDHVWRGYVQTMKSQAGDVRYRIEGIDRQEGEYAEYAPSTNYWYCSTEGAELPLSDKLDPADAETWSTLNLDATTGYAMFQFDESTLAFSVVHADYQNFNVWTDARGEVFVGNSTEDGEKSGTSPKKQTFKQDFDKWLAMPAEKNDWTFSHFTDVNHLQGRTAYVPFTADTDEAWSAGPGMWIARQYMVATNDAGVALQMEGNGKGFLQFVDAELAPRGVESFTFDARLGQFVLFEDFNYYYGDSMMSLSNYTFMTRVAFDLNSNKDFDGNASLSLAAAYLPNKGCYEARWECEDLPSKTTACRLSLYRWNVTSSGRNSKLLKSWKANFKMNTTTAFNDKTYFMPFFITVSNDVQNSCTWVSAGVRSTAMKLVDSMDGNLGGWCMVGYRDSSSSRLSRGTYGVLSANCDGVFGKPEFIATATLGASEELKLGANTGGNWTNKTRKFPNRQAKVKNFGTDDTEWNIVPGRMTTVRTSDDVSAIRSSPAEQKLEIYFADAGKVNWSDEPATNVAISTFGGKSFTVPLYKTENCSIKFAAGGSMSEVRTDIVLHSLKTRQWRGDDYSDGKEMVDLIPDWVDPYAVEPGYGLTNWIFTTAWIQNTVTGSGKSATTNGTILLSAKRTRSGQPASLRSPLMDGYRYANGTTRGTGLGMVSFDYANAQANAKLLVQIATNGVTSSSLESFDTLDPANWTTVDTVDFSKMTAAERKKGSASVYIGLHEVKGLMRILVDPELVASVQNVRDTSLFGEVTIDSVVCRDEPALDETCWWGWNLRTLGSANGRDVEKRMYLADLSPASSDVGMSLALNNSVSDGVDPSDMDTYRQNIPFLQTPTFSSNIVGEVSFKARKYDAASAQPSSLTLYGSKSGGADSDWRAITNFVVTSVLYDSFSYKTDPGSNYAAFRLGVSGVDGVQNAGPVVPEGYMTPVRVLVDEVTVSEAIRARMGFRNVGAFRSDMSGTRWVPNVPSVGEQPLCNEGWGVQCEVFAAQLENEIDMTRDPTVILHWFEGVEPWGYDNWCTSRLAHAAALARATDTNFVYRSSYSTAEGAVVPMSTVPGTVMQYMLEVRYYQVGAKVATTNYMTQADWTRPSWYRPVDYNADYGGNSPSAFSAYNILDSVAPGWAWINEVNILGEYDDDWENSEENAQFIEIAVPVEADISNWSVQLISGNMYEGGEFYTNTLAVFGSSELPGMKPGNMGEASNMVFRVLASPHTLDTLHEEDGTRDFIWDFSRDFEASETFLPDGRIFETDPFGIRLVRPSGVVEHEVMCIGTNFYGSWPGFEKYYSPTCAVEFLRRAMRESEIFYAGEDCMNKNAFGQFRSLGVHESAGETSNQWNNVMKRTPGRINEGQSIDPDHPTPNGESIIVFCTIDSAGHVRQTVGDAVESATTQTIFVRRGSDRGTNIVYTVDPWYELASVRTNGLDIAFDEIGTRRYEVNVGKGMSNNFTVVASAMIDRKLQGYGVTGDNPYTPAIMDWLSTARDLYGNGWEDPALGDIKLADLINRYDVVVTNLNLTQMYWLDMDPTVGGLALKGYTSDGPFFPKRTGDAGQTLTNVTIEVFMQITNRNTGAAWRPYALRGLRPGSSTLEYAGETAASGWNSATFKVVGFMNNGYTGLNVKDNWVPLRWFVFEPNSFAPPSAAKPFTCRIEVKDPFSTESPAYAAGWYDWAMEHGKPASCLYNWCLDERIQPITVEVLKENSTYGD